ncbi:MAG TPA: LacI family transcriptional regulator [Firmicutes bacterium]|nr:LacI family transcriptional regulator [Bacillota bacterium]
MGISQKIIADKLGISPSTVSRALRNDKRISEKTRRLVHQAADELGVDLTSAYKRPALTQISVAFFNKWAADFFGSAVLGMNSVASEEGINLITPKSSPCLTPETFLAAISEAVECQAMIIVHAGAVRIPHEILRQADARGITLVFLNRYEGCETNSVTLDDYAAGEHAARYLFNLGHRRLAHVTVPDTNAPLRQRRFGFQNTCELLGVYDPGLFVTLGSEANGLWAFDDDAVQILFKAKDRPSAIFAVNDRVAHHVLMEAQRCGLSIPKDLSVIGFDNMDLAEQLGLTTFDFRCFEMGRQAIKLAIELHKGIVKPPIHITLPPRLICRTSTSCPSDEAVG